MSSRTIDGSDRRVAILADLHIGRRDATDQFKADDEAFIEALEPIVAAVDRVFLLGDVLELQRGLFPFAHRYERDVITREHEALVDFLRGPKFLWFKGNHDTLLATTDGALEELTLDVGGKKALFLHGDRADWVVSEVPFVQGFGSWLGGIAERAGLRTAYSMLCSIDAALNGVHKDPSRCRLIARLLDYARSQNATRVFCGHIHSALAYQVDDLAIFRPGSSTDGTLRYIIIDRLTGETSHHQQRV